jgi:hypothetical protein
MVEGKTGERGDFLSRKTKVDSRGLGNEEKAVEGLSGEGVS